MSDRENCRVCGEKRPADAPSGLCPACLLKAGLLGEGSRLPDVTITFGPASSSVLASFGEAFGKIPPVLLRDADSVTDPGPVIQPSSSEIPDPADRSARLQLFGEIARGGMGAVLKGRDSDLGRDLAVKILLESHRDKPEMIRRFIEEAQIAGQLQHPGIVPIYELGAFGDRRPYFAMKLVKGHTLAEILANRKSAGDGFPRLLSIFESICQTMAYAHARGVIHRDLKPTNVMVGSFGEVQVMDWGLAKVLPRGGAVEDASAGHTKDQGTVIATARSDSDSDLSQAGSIMGTPSYMAPEQARGEGNQVDERADVFALGSILCELLTGQPAFTGRSSGEIQRKAARGDLSDAVSRVQASRDDPDLIALTEACLSPERDDRPRHAGEVAERIDAYRTGVQERMRQAELARAEETARAEEATKRARVERDRLRLALALAASILVLVVLGGGGGFWFYRQRQARLSSVEAVLVRVQTLREQAQSRGADPLPWREALAAAEQALASIGDLAATVPGRRLSALRDTIAEDEKRAKRETTFMADLADVRSKRGLKTMDAEKGYPKAFRRYGLDLTTTPVEQAITRLKTLPEALRHEVVTFLDDWAFARGGTENETAGPLALARGLDPDPERNRLRSLLENKDLKADADALSGMAKRPNLIESGPSTALLLASALERVDHKDAAIGVLRATVVRYPGDLWVNSELAHRLNEMEPPQSAEAIRYYSIVRALRPSSGRELADLLRDENRASEAEAIRRELTKLQPDDPRTWSELIELLKTRRNAEGIREIGNQWVDWVREQIKRAPNEAAPHLKAACVYHVLNDRPNQIAELKEAARLTEKGRLAIDHLLGHVLFFEDDLKGVANAYREALRVDPTDLNCVYELAFSLCLSGDHKGEVQALREAVRQKSVAAQRVEAYFSDVESYTEFFDDDFSIASNYMILYLHTYDQGYQALGCALAETGDLAGAIAACREAIRRDERGAMIHTDFSSSCTFSGSNDIETPYSFPVLSILMNDDPSKLIPELHEAIRLKPKLAATQVGFHLAVALGRSGNVTGAISTIRKAIEQGPQVRLDTLHLIWPIALIDQKKDLIAILRQLREGAKEDKAIVVWIDRAILLTERLMAMGSRLAKVFHGGGRGDVYSRMCRIRRLYALDAALWSVAFDVEPALLEDRLGWYRYSAACSAALAGCGKGKDQPPPADAERAKLRGQALTWLRAEFSAKAKVRETGTPGATKDLHGTLQHWREDPDLSGVRDPEALAKLPEAERATWRALWAEVESLEKRLRTTPP